MQIDSVQRLIDDLQKDVQFFGRACPRICEQCSVVFMQYDNRTIQKNCPSCMDRAQGRPTRVIARRCIHSFNGVALKSFPESLWKRVEGHMHNDEPYYSIHLHGWMYGGRLNKERGHISIFAKEPVSVDNILNVRIMESEHEFQKNVDGKLAMFTETRKYIVLSKSFREPESELYWVIDAHTDEHGDPSWKFPCRSGCPLWESEEIEGHKQEGDGGAYTITTASFLIVDNDNIVCDEYPDGTTISYPEVLPHSSPFDLAEMPNGDDAYDPKIWGTQTLNKLRGVV